MRFKIILIGGDSDNRIHDSPLIYDLQHESVYGSGVFTQTFDQPFEFDPPIMKLMHSVNPDFIFDGISEFVTVYCFFAHINY